MGGRRSPPRAVRLAGGAGAGQCGQRAGAEPACWRRARWWALHRRHLVHRAGWRAAWRRRRRGIGHVRDLRRRGGGLGAGRAVGAAIGALAGWRAASARWAACAGPGAERAVAAGTADDPLAARPALMAALHNPDCAVASSSRCRWWPPTSWPHLRAAAAETRAGFAGDWIGPLLFAYGVAGVAGNFVAGWRGAAGAAGAAGHRRRAGPGADAARLAGRQAAGRRPAAGLGPAYGGVSVSLHCGCCARRRMRWSRRRPGSYRPSTWASPPARCWACHGGRPGPASQSAAGGELPGSGHRGAVVAAWWPACPGRAA